MAPRQLTLLMSALLFGLACGPRPAGEFETKTDSSCSFGSWCWLRFVSAADLLDNSPGYGRFFDDYLELVIEEDGGSPQGALWRHGMIGDVLDGARFGNRHGLAVNGRHQTAVTSSTALWLYDENGTLVHGYAHGGWPSDAGGFGWLGYGGNVVAYADDDHVWAATTFGAPFLTNLADVELSRGPLIEFSWERDVDPNASWSSKSASVLGDGTLIWLSGDGVTRALATDGGVRWSNTLGSGPFTISEDGRVFSYDFYDKRLVAMAAQTGTSLLQLEQPAWRLDSSFVEGGYIGPRFTVFDPYKKGLVTIDSHSGEILATHKFDGGWFADELSSIVYFAGDIAMASDNSVFVTTDSAQPRTVINKLFSYAPDLTEQWMVRHAYTRFVVPSEHYNRIYVVAGDFVDDDVSNFDTRFALYGYDSITGEELFKYPLTGFDDYAPILKDGTLYLTTLISTPEGSVAPSSMNGRVRRDGGVIDAQADYQCLGLDMGYCAAFEGGQSNYFRIVWAFRVE